MPTIEGVDLLPLIKLITKDIAVSDMAIKCLGHYSQWEVSLCNIRLTSAFSSGVPLVGYKSNKSSDMLPW